MGGKRVVRSPDGRVWTITVSRFRAPKWLPVAFVRSLFSSRRWIEARSNDTSPIVALWSADRRDAQLVAEELTESLTTGYEWSSPAGSEFVEMTEPPGLHDRDH